jgi:thiamine biosynthesis lipoprotein
MIHTVYPTVAVLAACILLVVGGCGRQKPADEGAPARIRETRRLMGVPWTITVYAGEAAAHAAIAAAFAEISRLEGILSDYDPGSELSQLSAASPTSAPVAVGDDLWRVLSTAVAWRDRSGGAFDPTVGPLTTLWRQARRSGVMPRADKLAAARQAVGPDTLVLDVNRRTAMLVAPAMRLDLGGIGMGYAIDRGMEVLAERGIGSAMIDASGDIAVSGPPPGKAAWTIEVAAGDGGDGRRPMTLELVDAAVTTSGDAFQAVEIDGVRYSHVVDPRTGLGVAGPAAVTVIAADCTTADAVATAANVLGPEAGLAFVETVPGAAARFVMSNDGEQRETHSTRWPAQFTQPRRSTVRL